MIVEGFRDLRLQDPKIDALLASPLFDKLRRYRNAIFHFQKEWFVSEKHMDFFEDHDAPA